mgnify:CR=1 FL=1
MNGWMNSLVDTSVQCWGCAVFDRLFQVVSYAAGAVYKQFTIFCVILFCVFFAFFIINAVWQNIRGGMRDPWYSKSVRPVIINSLVALSLLSLGVMVPRFMTQITFEPATEIAIGYTQTMLQTNAETVNEKVTYQPMKMDDTGFYRPEMRDKIILLMKTTITQFQTFIKLGIAVMDSAFTWKALLGIGALIKHIIIFFVGLYLAYGFFKLFCRFCFYFADIIIAMTFFAFFFPLSLMLVSFKGASDVPSWMSKIGSSLGVGQFKNLMNAIIALASAVLTYTVIMVLIATFFAAHGTTSADLMQVILSGDVFNAELSDDNLAELGIASSVVLIYVLNFIQAQIPKVTGMVLDTFGVSEDHKLGDQLANDAETLTRRVVETAAKTVKTIVKGGNEK